MRVMVIVKATKESEAESHPLEMEGAEEMFEQMGRFNEELIKAGIMLVGDGLKPSKFGKRIHFNGTKRPRDRGGGERAARQDREEHQVGRSRRCA